eukprot:tig00021617_g22938.t1
MSPGAALAEPDAVQRFLAWLSKLLGLDVSIGHVVLAFCLVVLIMRAWIQAFGASRSADDANKYLPAVFSKSHLESAIREASEAGLLLGVFFFSTQCEHSKRLAPRLVAIGKHVRGVAFRKVDADALRPLAAEHSVDRVPYVLFFRGGKEAARLFGNDEDAVRAMAKQLLAAGAAAKKAS